MTRSRSYLVPSGCQTRTGYSHNLRDLNSRSVIVLPKCHSQKIGFRYNVSPMGHCFKIGCLDKDDSGRSNSFSLTTKIMRHGSEQEKSAGFHSHPVKGSVLFIMKQALPLPDSHSYHVLQVSLTMAMLPL